MDNGAKLAVEAINAAGGIAALGGAKLELLSADTQGKPEVGQSEAQRLIQEGAVGLVGTYQSAVTANVSSVAERNKVPLVIDVSSADSILPQGYQYTFRRAAQLHRARHAGGRSTSSEVSTAAGHAGEDGGDPARAGPVRQRHHATSFTAEGAEASAWTVGPVIAYDAAKRLRPHHAGRRRSRRPGRTC